MREQVRDGRPVARPLVQTEGDSGGVPEQQADHDRRDQREDQVGLAEMAAVEATRALDLADPDGGEHAAEHEDAEDVDEQRVPPLVAEPREGRVPIDDPDHRDHDRRPEHEEAPEDEGVHQPRPEAGEQLALAEDDRDLVARPLRRRAAAVGRLRATDERDQLDDAAAEERAAEPDRRGEQDGGDRRAYAPRTLLSSAEIAGTTSCRSPITP